MAASAADWQAIAISDQGAAGAPSGAALRGAAGGRRRRFGRVQRQRLALERGQPAVALGGGQGRANSAAALDVGERSGDEPQIGGARLAVFAHGHDRVQAFEQVGVVGGRLTFQSVRSPSKSRGAADVDAEPPVAAAIGFQFGHAGGRGSSCRRASAVAAGSGTEAGSVGGDRLRWRGGSLGRRFGGRRGVSPVAAASSPPVA